jgi:hypothetical protein
MRKLVPVLIAMVMYIINAIPLFLLGIFGCRKQFSNFTEMLNKTIFFDDE